MRRPRLDHTLATAGRPDEMPDQKRTHLATADLSSNVLPRATCKHLLPSSPCRVQLLGPEARDSRSPLLLRRQQERAATASASLNGRATAMPHSVAAALDVPPRRWMATSI